MGVGDNKVLLFVYMMMICFEEAKPLLVASNKYKNSNAAVIMFGFLVFPSMPYGSYEIYN